MDLQNNKIFKKIIECNAESQLVPYVDELSAIDLIKWVPLGRNENN